MSTLKSIGTKVMTAVIATGLLAAAAFAAGSTLTVNLPQAVNVGGTTLESGQYTVSEMSMAGGRTLFVFRSDKGATASAMAMKSAEAADDQKTAVVFSNEGGSLHLDKMFIEGESTGYQFADSK